MDIGNEDLKKVTQMLKKAKGKTDDELIKDIARMIRTGQGGITPEKARNLIKMVAPMLEASQKVKLEKLLNELNT